MDKKPPELSPHTFLQDVRSALLHLDDPAYLENHALGQRLRIVQDSPDLSRGQVLRRVLRLAIEELDPGPHVPPGSPEGRPYHIMSRRYVTKQSMALIGASLGISERQAYRELEVALEALARILRSIDECPTSDRRGVDSPGGLASREVRRELDSISNVEPQDVDLGKLIASALADVSHLAQDKDLNLVFRNESTTVNVQLNRVALRQAIVNLLSHAVRTHVGTNIELRLTREEDAAVLTCDYSPQASYAPVSPEQPRGMSEQLFGLLGIKLERVHNPNGQVLLQVRIPIHRGHTLLVIDDNAGFTALVRRYLRNQPYFVHSASDFQEGVQAMKDVCPDVILLDVMMPRQDGWETLQALRACPAGRRARVLVCSIIDDPDLAFALGADGFLHKPITRAELVHSLTRVILSA